MAYISAHLSHLKSETISFDSDAQEAIVDTGCSRTLTYDRNDFITYDVTSGEVEGLGIHKIIGTGTVQYTVVDDTGETIQLRCRDAIHVPSLTVRLVSPQQIMQQDEHMNTEAIIQANSLLFKWDGHIKFIPYNSESNLPVLVTAPGSKLATAYICKHFTTWNKAHLAKDNKNVNWDTRLIHRNKSLLPPELESTIPNEPILLNPTHGNTIKKKQMSETIVNKSDNFLTSMSVCEECSPEHSQTKKHNNSNKCKVCKPYASLSKNARLLLHYHNILDHMGFEDLKDLARKGFLPHNISLAEKVVCAACQMGKAHKLARGKTPIVNKEDITDPGDLVHMDQAESTNPGRPLTHSGRNCKQKIHVVTIFIDSISKKVYAGFQRSTNAKETVNSKLEFEIDSMYSGVGLKSFRADNGIFKSTEFKLDLTEKDQRITFCGVGARHQNGVAERHIRTFVEKARTVLLNASAKWPGKIKMEL